MLVWTRGYYPIRFVFLFFQVDTVHVVIGLIIYFTCLATWKNLVLCLYQLNSNNKLDYFCTLLLRNTDFDKTVTFLNWLTIDNHPVAMQAIQRLKRIW